MLYVENAYTKETFLNKYETSAIVLRLCIY